MSDKIALKVQAEILKRSVRRKRMKNNPKIRERIFREHKGICHECGEHGADVLDHVVPVKCGGSDHPMNLRPAHTSCNNDKGARWYPMEAHEHEEMWLPGWFPSPALEIGQQPTIPSGLPASEVDLRALIQNHFEATARSGSFS